MENKGGKPSKTQRRKDRHDGSRAITRLQAVSTVIDSSVCHLPVCLSHTHTHRCTPSSGCDDICCSVPQLQSLRDELTHTPKPDAVCAVIMSLTVSGDVIRIHITLTHTCSHNFGGDLLLRNIHPKYPNNHI